MLFSSMPRSLNCVDEVIASCSFQNRFSDFVMPNPVIVEEPCTPPSTSSTNRRLITPEL
jgi:hypothetical protein